MAKIYAQPDPDDISGISTLPKRSFVTYLFTLRDRSLLPKYVIFQQTHVHLIAILILLIYTTASIFRSVDLYNHFPSKLSLFLVLLSIFMFIIAWIGFTLRTLVTYEIL